MALLIFALGLLFGSFFNVLIWRIPRDESVVFPSSHCPACQHRLAPGDLVPVVSWLLLRGKCRYCGERIPVRYPLVELVTALLWTGLWLRFDPTSVMVGRWAILPYLVLTSLALVAAFIDLDHEILPDVLTIPGIAAGLLTGGLATALGTAGQVALIHPLKPFYFEPFSLWTSLIGAAAGAGVILLIVLASRGGMGYGDVKFLAMVGAFTGARGALATLFLGALLGSVVGIFLLVTGRKKRKDAIPFGPFLAAAVILLTFLSGPALNFFQLGG